MGIWNKILGTVTGGVAESHIIPRVGIAMSSIYDNKIVDKQIANEIQNAFLEKHGQEVFFCDLDSYVTNSNLIENLINTVRGNSSIVPSNQVEFASTNTQRFIEQNRKYKCKGVQQKQVYEIFAWMFDFAFSKANTISPHIDSGKLQNELHRVDSASEWRDDRTLAAVESMRRESEAYAAKILSILNPKCSTDAEDIESCPAEFEILTLETKSVESEYQFKNQFEIAILKYYELLQSVTGLITSQNQKYANTLVCTLNCNIALCQANLADIDKAYRSLEAIPKTTAESSKTYHFVYAAVSIQSSDSAKYSDAQIHLDCALEIDPLYHRAFLLRQYLYALMGAKDCPSNIIELNDHFATVIKDNADMKLISDFYMNRGVIYLTYNDPYSASDDFYKALELGSDEFVAKLNLSAALYAQAVISLPRGERFFCPKVDSTKISSVLTQLKPIVTNIDIDTSKYKLVAEKAVELYVSACSMIGIQHGLSPVTKYLGLTQYYETQRALILGCQEELSDATLSILDETDRIFIDCRTMLKHNEFDKCKEMLIELYSLSPDLVSAPLFHMLLQIFIATKDSNAYWVYRASALSAGVDGGILAAMDACALELDGKHEEAKPMFDSIAITSDDYQLLDNTLRFYKRNMFTEECAALYFCIQEKHERKEIFLEDLNEFYSGAISFLTSVNSEKSEELLNRINPQEVSSSVFLRLQATVYSKTNNIDNLATCMEQIYADEHVFQDGFNLALCQKLLMRYDSSLKTCFSLQKHHIEDEKRVKLYWLISDLYLLKEDLDESFDWAQKSHELMIQNPYDISHQALLGRALRCGHHEGFTSILKYKETHPVVLDWIQPFRISDEENPIESLTKQLEKFSPNTMSYSEQEKDIATKYKTQTIPNNFLLEFYHNDLHQFFRFAEKNKLRVAMGNRDQLKNQESCIDCHIAVDAQTLIILAYFECLPAIQSIEHIHINYGTLNTLQYYYVSADYLYIRDLLKWIETAGNIVFHQDGVIDENDVMTKVLSRDFVASCITANDYQIPLLYSDSIAPECATLFGKSIFQSIKFVSIPELCNFYGRKQSRARDQMLYRLLTGCTFISFSASTIIEQIQRNNCTVSAESIKPFLICKSDYDMKSFADVYLQAIYILYESGNEAAVPLAEIIADNAFIVWRRGTYYRTMVEEHGIIDYKKRAMAISGYVLQIATGIKQMIHDLPDALGNKCDELISEVTKDLTSSLFPMGTV